MALIASTTDSSMGIAHFRQLVDGGSTDATDVLVELAGERGDRDELRRLAALGSRDAADVLVELDDRSPEDGAA